MSKVIDTVALNHLFCSKRFKKIQFQMWTPISLQELQNEIQKYEINLNGELRNFWQRIRIEPEKWQEQEYGNEGGGFWIVGIYGKKVVWYNDIEEGFNISTYSKYGKIDEYSCEQNPIDWTINKLYATIESGK